MYGTLWYSIFYDNNITARPWGLPGLATSVRASQDDDDDEEEDDDDADVFDIFLKPYLKPKMIAWLIVPRGRGIWYFLEALKGP